MTTAEFFARSVHNLTGRTLAQQAAQQRIDISNRVNETAIRLLTDYAETVQSKARLIEINAVIIALGGRP